MIYLATPYSHPQPIVMKQRYQLALEKTAELISKGMKVFSPIVHSHPLLEYGNIPGDADFWWDWNKHHLDSCTELCVYQMPGWEQSNGIAMELRYAEMRAMPITHLAFVPPRKPKF